MLLQKSGLLPIPKILTVLSKHMFCNHISKTLSLCLQRAVLLPSTPQGCKLCQMLLSPTSFGLGFYGINYELAHIFLLFFSPPLPLIKLNSVKSFSFKYFELRVELLLQFWWEETRTAPNPWTYSYRGRRLLLTIQAARFWVLTKLSNNQAGKFHDTELYTSVKCKTQHWKIVHRLFLLRVYKSCSEMQRTLRTVLSGERGNMPQGSIAARF